MKKVILIRFFLFLVLISILYFVISLLFIYFYPNKDYSDKKVDAVIILGAEVLSNEQPTWSLQNRIDSAANYLKNNKDTVVVATGGKGSSEPVSEASVIKNKLIEQNISNKILVEDNSTNTFENLMNAKAILDKYFDKPYTVMIVTNKYHVFRATLIANRLHLKKYYLVAKDNYYLIPKINYKGAYKPYLRETISVLKFLVIDNFKIKS